MHIPDGFLSPATCAVTYAAMVPIWAVAARRMSTSYGTPAVSRIGLAAAFSFALMMFNVPIPGGTTGHAVGTSLITIALGPWGAILAVSTTLLIQALMFGDGGITAFAANCLGMAVVPAVCAWVIWKAFAPAGSSKKIFATAFAAGYIPVFLGALLMATLLGIQPSIASDASGSPRFFPFGLGVSITAIGVAHIFICLIEGIITATAAVAMARMPEFSDIFARRPDGATRPWHRRTSTWAAAATLAVMVPAGALLPEWAGAAEPWGEWSPAETAEKAGLTKISAEMERLSDKWAAPIPDYTFSESASPAGSATQYTGAGLLGIVLIGLLFSAVQKVLTRQSSIKG